MMKGGKTIYFTAPCDLWRGLINDKNRVLEDVAYWHLVLCNYDFGKTRLTYPNEERAMERATKLGGCVHSDVLFSISLKMFFDYLQLDKSKEDLLLLLFYLASKSIVGRKKYVLTNNRHVWCRMAGYESIRTWDGGNDQVDEIIKDHIENNRKMQRKTENLRVKAAASFIQYCSYSERGLRGFYFSTKATSIDEKTQIMREMREAAKRPTKRQQEAGRLRGIRNE